ERGNAHLAHQPANALAIDGMALRPQQRRHSPRAEEWPGGEQLVDPPHQHEIVVIGGRGRSVQARSCNAQQLALPAQRTHGGVAAVDEPTAVRGAHLPDLLAKKSRSTMSWPILACSRSISRSCSAAPSPLPFWNARAA